MREGGQRSPGADARRQQWSIVHVRNGTGRAAICPGDVTPDTVEVVGAHDAAFFLKQALDSQRKATTAPVGKNPPGLAESKAGVPKKFFPFSRHLTERLNPTYRASIGR